MSVCVVCARVLLVCVPECRLCVSVVCACLCMCVLCCEYFVYVGVCVALSALCVCVCGYVCNLCYACVHVLVFVYDTLAVCI